MWLPYTHTREWPPCIRLCGIIPDSVVLASGIGEGERWRKRCMDLGRVPRHWLQRPLEDVEDRLREVDRLAEAGAAWAAQDTHPWQLFAMKLHEMFLGVLRDRKGADDKAGSLFPTSHRKEPRNTYPSHLLQLPQPQGVPTPPPRTGGHAEGMAMGPRPPTHGNPVDDGATVGDDAAYGAPTAAGPLAGLVHGAGSGF